MTLLIAYLLIYGFGIDPVMYVFAGFLWVGHVIFHGN